MIRYAPNISWLFKELPFSQRASAVADAGFHGLEFGFPSEADIPSLEAAREELGLQIVLFNMEVPDRGEDNLGYLVDMDQRDKFYANLDDSLELAQRLQASKVMVLAGLQRSDVSYEAQWECMIKNLRYAGPLAADADVLITVEALNRIDIPSFFIHSSKQALDLIREISHPNIKFQFDTYHLQRTEGNLTHTIVENVEWIGHIQFGDVPGRAEPGTGEIHFENLTIASERAGYEGFIGLEYNTQKPGAETLAWVPKERR